MEKFLRIMNDRFWAFRLESGSGAKERVNIQDRGFWLLFCRVVSSKGVM